MHIIAKRQVQKMKSYTDIEQSKKLAEILPLESADYHYITVAGKSFIYTYSLSSDDIKQYNKENRYVYCWSFAALFKYLSEIKPQVYTPILFPSKGKWILQFAEYGHGNVCEMSCDNPVDACVDMVEKLHKLKML